MGILHLYLLNSATLRGQQLYSMLVKVAQSCPTLCNPMDYTVRGILQARILEWVAFPFSSGSSRPRNGTRVSCIAGIFFTKWAAREAQVKVTLSCLTFCNPMDYTVRGILQARILEWVAYPFSSGSSRPRNLTGVSCIAGRFFAS